MPIPTFTDGTVVHQADLAQLLDLPKCFAYNSAAFTAGVSGTAIVLTMNSTLYDTDATMHSTSTNTSRVFINTAGKYVFTTMAVWAGNATGYRQVDIRKNAGGSAAGGTRLWMGIKPAEVVTSLTENSAATAPIPMSVGEYVEVFLYQTSGGSLATTTGFVGAAGSISASFDGI